MMGPVIDREPVSLPTLSGHNDELWSTLVELTNNETSEWTLIGGQMVFLHALENEVQPPRVSTDLDILVNVRVATKGLRIFVNMLERSGFELAGTSPEGLAHRCRRREVSIDVLAPEGIGQRTDLTTTPPGRTLAVPGGTQALQRTELVPVTCGGGQGYLPRPSLLGAIVAKAVAVDLDDTPEAQRQDLALLLSLVVDPFDLKGQLTKKDRKRIQARTEMEQTALKAWQTLLPTKAAQGQATYRILSS